MLAERLDDVTPIEVTEILDPSDIRVIRILNPFNPADRVNETLSWGPNKTMRDYFPLGAVHNVVSVNGKIIPEDDFAVTYLERGDNLVVCPVPEGGGGNDKSILGMIAMIIVAIVAPYAAPGVAGAMGITSAAGVAAVQAGIMMAGSMLVNAVMASSQKSSSGEEGHSYGIDGAKNTSLEGIPVPVCYGRFRMAGNVIQVHTEPDGASDDQVLYMLFNAGEGPISGISDIRINDQPIANYSGVEAQVRLGLNEQPVIPWFSNTIVPQTKNLKLTTSWTTHTTTTAVEKLRFDVTWPAGLYYNDVDDNAIERNSVDLEIQYRKQGTSEWTPLRFANVTLGWVTARYTAGAPTAGMYMDSDRRWWKIFPDNHIEPVNAPVGEWRYLDGARAGQPLDELDLAWIEENLLAPARIHNETVLPESSPPNPEDGYITPLTLDVSVPVFTDGVARVTSDRKTAIRRAFYTQLLPQEIYEVRIRRTTDEVDGDTSSITTCFLTDVNEIQLEPLIYPNTALLGLRIPVGEQINGLPNVSYLVDGKLVAVHGRPIAQATSDLWYSSASSNPAWIVWDMLTNRRYGGGIPTAKLDFAAFKKWAAYCDQEGLRFNGVIDSEMNVWDAAQLPLRVGHAQLVNIGTRFGVVVESPSVPVMMFSVANMVKDSYKETWLPMTDRANEIDVSFFDKEDDYKQRTIKIYDPSVLTSGRKQRSSAVTLFGVDNADQAWREGIFHMNLNRFILKTVSFSAPLEAIACTVGDLILVQHDMPNWAQAGRFEAGSTTSVVKLDRPAVMEAGKTYKLLVHYDKVARATGTITSIAGNTLVLSGFAGDKPVRRLVVGTKDIRVDEVYPGNVVVESAVGLTPGESYIAYDTDAIEEVGVVLAVGETDTLTLQTPLAVAPAQFGQWMFGEVSKVRQTFRIKGITTNSDHTREITAIQYDERVYTTDRFPTAEAPAPNPAEVQMTQVRDLDLYEETRIVNSSLVSQVVATWRLPEWGVYKGADIYVRRGIGANDPFVFQGSVTHSTDVAVSGQRGETIGIKVVGFDMADKRVPYAAAPEDYYQVVGEVPGINVGAVSGLTVLWSGRDCRLNWRYNSVTHSYEFGSEPVGGDAGSLDPHFKDYEVRVYDYLAAADADPRRIEYVTDSAYIYTYEKNYADGAARRLRFEIRMRDIFNNLGDSAVVTAENASPQVTSLASNANFEMANIAWTHNGDIDYAGTMVWLSVEQSQVDGDITRPGFNANLVYDGPDLSATIGGLMFNTDYYVRVACYDVFGKTELLPSGIIHFKTPHLNVQAIAEGVIGESLLVQELQDRIDLVDGPASMAGSVAARLAQETSDRTAAILVETNARTAAIQAEATARTDAIAAEAAARGAAITSEANTRQTADDSLSSQITTLTASVNDNTAAIQTEQTARVNADNALSSSITALTARMGDAEADIVSEQTARASGDTANANAITALTTRVSTAEAAIVTEQTARADADEALTDDLTALTSRVGTAEAAIVTEQNTRATADSALSSSITVLTGRVDDAEADILSEQTARANADSALTTSINALTTRVGDAEADIVSEQTARADADTALSNTINALTTTVNGNTAAIAAEQTARSNGDTANASSITALAATIGGASGNEIDNAEFALNLDGWLQSGNGDGFVFGRNLNSSWVVGNGTAYIHEDFGPRAGYYSEIQPAESIPVIAGKRYQFSAYTAAHRCNVILFGQWLNADGSHHSYFGGVTGGATSNEINADETDGGNTLAGYKRLYTFATAPAGVAICRPFLRKETTLSGFTDSYLFATRLFFAEARAEQTVPDPYSPGGNNKVISSAIANESVARVDGDNALSSSISTLTTTVNGHTTSIQTQATSIDGLSGKYTVKIDNDGYVVGFGLASTANNGTPTSEFVIRADKFVMTMPGYAGVYPFTIGPVDGVPKVIIHSALIGDATIGTAKIGDATITNAKIGSEIYSSNWSGAGGSGWYLNKNGNFYVNNIWARGDIHATSIAASTVYTDAIVGAAVTSTYASTGTSQTSLSVSCPSGSTSLIILADPGWLNDGSGYATNVTYLIINGSETIPWVPGFQQHVINNPSGTYDITLYSRLAANFASPSNTTCKLAALVTKR